MDRYDVPFLINDINNQMPYHSDNFAKIPNEFGIIPKNLMNESHKRQNSFLNDNLCYIEESISKNLLTKQFVYWFLRQNKKYHYSADILSHDSIFNSNISSLESIGNSNIQSVSGGGSSPVNGPDLEAGGTTIHQVQSASFIYSILLPSANVTDLYDRLALNAFSGGANYILGAYDDSSNLPNNLLASTASMVLASGFNWKTVTEFQIATVRTYCAFQVSNSSQSIYQNSASTNSLDGNVFGSLTDPFVESATSTDTPNVKMGHT